MSYKEFYKGRIIFLNNMNTQFRSFLKTAVTWYKAKDRWWVPLAAGLLYTICHPPFNHETHPLLFIFPFTVFVTTIPLFFFALEESRKSAFLKSYLFGITASATQFYWLANVVVEGVWLLILLSLFLLTLFIALLFMVYGMIFRYMVKIFGPLYIIIFPAIWIVIEFIRTLGDISFPWELSGYALTPILPLVQFASVTGVYGLSFLVILGNIVIWELIKAFYSTDALRSKIVQFTIFCLFLILITAWGTLRLNKHRDFNNSIRISLIQNNIDQANWEGRISLDTSMTITEQMVYTAAQEKPDLMLFPESGIYCYLERNRKSRMQVLSWSDSIKIPMILGALHFEREIDNPYYKYRVYNAIFFLAEGKKVFERYFKIKLVPFSEGLPFEGILPVLSRVNLGESDFHRGTEEMYFSIHDKWHSAPFLCYEIIFPDFVRRRVRAGANVLVNLTNDGWFGRSTAPFHHAAMARMRTIENGVSLARCANSGISMLVDPVGRIVCKTGLYERTILTGKIPYDRIGTIYNAFGDWVIWVSLLLIAGAFVYATVLKIKRRITI